MMAKKTLRQQIQELEDQNKELSEALDSACIQLENCTQKCNSSKSQLDQTTKELEKEKNKADHLEKILTRLNETISSRLALVRPLPSKMHIDCNEISAVCSASKPDFYPTNEQRLLEYMGDIILSYFDNNSSNNFGDFVSRRLYRE